MAAEGDSLDNHPDLASSALGAGAVYAYQQYRAFRLAQVVRHAFAAGKYEMRSEPLERWLESSLDRARLITTRRGMHWRRTSRGKPSRPSIEPESWASTRTGSIA